MSLRKVSIIRLSIALCCNATRTEKLKPIAIEKSKNPRCFEKKNLEDLPFIWESNRSLWMILLTFKEWIRKLDTILE